MIIPLTLDFDYLHKNNTLLSNVVWFSEIF